MNNLKTITVGDLHGLNKWQSINPADYDYIIFIGDYMDSFTIQNVLMLENIMNILEFKKQYPDKVILLYGNHDIHYLYAESTDYRCTGYRPEIALTFKEIFIHYNSLFQIAFQHDNVLWTHAGVNSKWAKKYLVDVNILEYAEYLNSMMQDRISRDIIMEIGHRRGGFHDTGGPMWSDQKDNKRFPIDHLIQIYGHTAQDEIKIIKKKSYELINVDCLEKTNKFYEHLLLI